MIIILYAIALLIYMAVPMLGKIVLFVLNIFVPDPLPYIDEIVMFLGLVRKWGKK